MSNENIPPDQIKPLHPARQPKLLKELIANMKAEGWQGRPLLVIETKAGYQAWTGSHRIAAAVAADLPNVPCYVVAEAELERVGADSVFGHVEDYERLQIMHKVGDETAIHLMWTEGRVD